MAMEGSVGWPPIRTTSDWRRRSTAPPSCYQRARPEYPAEFYDRVLAVTGLTPPARLLEVGPATGKATLPLARRGFHITGVEPGAGAGGGGPERAWPASTSTSSSPAVRGLGPGRGALRPRVLGHGVALGRPGRPLPKGGRGAPAGRLPGAVGGGPRVPGRRRPVLRRPAARLRRDRRAPPADLALAAAAGAGADRPRRSRRRACSTSSTSCQYAWEQVYDADGYIDLLDTFSGHIAMEDWRRDRFYGELRRLLAERPDGTLRRGIGAASCTWPAGTGRTAPNGDDSVHPGRVTPP